MKLHLKAEIFQAKCYLQFCRGNPHILARLFTMIIFQRMCPVDCKASLIKNTLRLFIQNANSSPGPLRPHFWRQIGTATQAQITFILASGHMEEELSTFCRAAANALEILSNLRPGFTRNVIPRMNSTALSVSQPNNEDRQVNNEELQSNERSTSPASSSSIQARLATLFPTVGSNRGSTNLTQLLHRNFSPHSLSLHEKQSVLFAKQLLLLS